jgi:hypothetical protein
MALPREWRPGRALLLATAVAAAIAAGISSAGRAAEPKPPSWALHGPYSPHIDPANFVTAIDNPYFPLKPGTAFHYTGFKDGVPQTDDMVVTHLTKRILGVRCTVVRDTVFQHGKPLERTFDWYAQDKQGNVWYMGEDSLELRDGRFVRADDSWETHVDGAEPGIIMRGRPRAGQIYRQEYYPAGGALDQARVLGLHTSLSVPYGTFTNALATMEWSPVEPQYEKKVYAAGVGEIAEQVVQGGHERFTLVSVTHA